MDVGAGLRCYMGVLNEERGLVERGVWDVYFCGVGVGGWGGGTGRHGEWSGG